MADFQGKQIGTYRLTRLLGHGGFADVYLGTSVHLKTPAAIKLLRAQLTTDDANNFRREARTIANLRHPHIARVLDFGVENMTPFLVMEYAPGGNMRQRYPRGSVVKAENIVPYVKQIASALQYAHNQGIIHRDIKPENILLGPNGEILLSDFGIALVTKRILEESRNQDAREAVGTVVYMAPEQYEGQSSPASDQYALGVMVYEWLCGQPPFEGTFPQIARMHMFTPPPSLREKKSDLAADVEKVVFAALAKDPLQRFRSVQAFATALEQAFQENVPPSIPHIRQPQPPVPPTVPTDSPSLAPTQPSLSPEPQYQMPVPALPPQPSYSPPAPSGYGIPGSSSPSWPGYPPPQQPGMPRMQAESVPNAPVVLPGPPSWPGYPPPLPATPTVQPQKKGGLPRTTLILILMIIVVLIAGSVGGVFALNQHNAALNATATATAGAETQQAEHNGTSTAVVIAQTQAAATQTAVAVDQTYPFSSDLILDDPLIDNSKGFGWDIGSGCSFTGGSYHVNNNHVNSFIPCFSGKTNFSNFTLQVDMTIDQGDTSANEATAGGVIFASDPTGSNGYILIVDLNGLYVLGILRDGKVASKDVLKTGQSGSFHAGLNQSNTLSVVLYNGHILLYANSQLITCASDNTYTSGGIGFLSLRGQTKTATDVAYNNAKVWQLTAPQLPC